MRPYADANEARIDRQAEQRNEVWSPMTPREILAAGQSERDALNAQHRIDMLDPVYAASYWAALDAKIKRNGPASGRISRRHAQEFETPMGPPALKTREQLRVAELARRKEE